jgi:F-type H+-transporting ATPase subunit c
LRFAEAFFEGSKLIGAGLATIGLVFGSLVSGISRNPAVSGRIFGYAMLGFALTEAVGLLALMMAFLISFLLEQHDAQKVISFDNRVY